MYNHMLSHAETQDNITTNETINSSKIINVHLL